MAAKQGVKALNAYDVTTSATEAYELSTTYDRAVISTSRITNRDTSSRILQLWIYPSTATPPDNQYKAYVNKQIPKEATINLSEIIEEPLAVGDTIYIQADANDALTFTLGLTTYLKTS